MHQLPACSYTGSYWTVSYLVRLEDNRLVRRHQYHLRRRTVSSAPEPVETSGVPDDQEEGLEEVHLEFQKEPPPPPVPTTHEANIPGDAHPSVPADPPGTTVSVQDNSNSQRVAEEGVRPLTPRAKLTPRTTKTYPRRNHPPPDREGMCIIIIVVVIIVSDQPGDTTTSACM